MKFKLPDLTIDLNLELKGEFERIRCIKTTLVMVLSYWIDISETSKTYYDKVSDKELGKSRLRNLRMFANPRLINFLLPARQDGRRLNEINDSLYGALEHGIIYESNNPYMCPRILSIGHAFSHLDSTLDDTEGLGNPNKSHFLLDMLIFNANKFFDEVEIAIIKTLIKSRIKIFLANDYRDELFKNDPSNNLKRLREMFLSLLVMESTSELADLSGRINLTIQLKKIEDALKIRISRYSTIEDLSNYDFLDFMNIFISSIRVGSDYKQMDLINLRTLVNRLPKSSSNFCWIKEIIDLTDKDPSNVGYLESVVLPRFDQILTTRLEKYYTQTDIGVHATV